MANKKKSPLLVLLVFISLFFYIRQDKDLQIKIKSTLKNVSKSKTESPAGTIPDNPGLPAGNASAPIIKKTGYTLQYSEEWEQALWVSYELTSEELTGEFPRKDAFRADPDIPSESASLQDYRKSGFDRGHLAPAADMKWAEEVMRESFFLSNMSPQKPDFNRGIWKKLEARVREWAKENTSLYIVTGPVFLKDRSIETIGDNRVAIPHGYYKVLLDLTEPEIKAAAFYLPHEKSGKELHSFMVSIDQVEGLTSLDFFPALPDPLENRLEQESKTSLWFADF